MNMRVLRLTAALCLAGHAHALALARAPVAPLAAAYGMRPQAMPRLAPARSAQLSMQAAAAGDGKGGPLAKLRAKLPPPAELKKVTPLGAMFFFILFAYTILRDTKAGLSLPLLRLFPAAVSTPARRLCVRRMCSS